MTHDGENIMVILSSPSGVGKTTLTKKIQQKYPNFKIIFSPEFLTERTSKLDMLTQTESLLAAIKR